MKMSEFDEIPDFVIPRELIDYADRLAKDMELLCGVDPQIFKLFTSKFKPGVTDPMTSLSQSESAKLAAELAKVGATTGGPDAIPDWGDVEELVEMAYVVQDPLSEDPTATISLNYEQAANLYKKLDRECDERKKRMDDIKIHLQAALMVSGKKKVRAGEWHCQMVEKAGSTKVSVPKLMSKGVSAAIIAECTEVGKSSNYIMIKGVSEKDKEY